MNLSDMVNLFKTIKKIYNFFPHKIIIYDDKDPPWINISIMRLIQVTMRHLNFLKVAIIPITTLNMFNPFRANKDVLLKPQNEDIILVYQKKLMNPSTSHKTNRHVRISFLNNKRIEFKSPIFHEKRFITNFKENAK